MGDISRKNKAKINVIDVVIILLVLALVATAAYRIYGEVTKNTSSKQSNCILTFEYVGTSDVILDYLKAGDAVYLKGGTLLGYLYDERADDADGAVYKVIGDELEETVNSTVTLRGGIKLSVDAHKAQGAEYYVINGINIKEGGTLAIYTEKTEMNIIVKSLNDSK